MKNLNLSLIIAALFLNIGYSQMWNGQDTLYGNEWIEYDQEYYKLQVDADGIYRVTYESMLAAGIPVASVDAANFQLFELGQEIPIHVSNSGNLGAGDYIEFYGKQNRSEMDRWMFPDPSHMLNPRYSLYTDNTTYFLTWSSSASGERYTEVANDLTNAPEKEKYYWEELFKDNIGTHKKNYGIQSGVFYSHYDESEGFGSKNVANGLEKLKPTQIYTEEDLDVELTIRIGLDKEISHNVAISVNDSLLGSSNFELPDPRTISYTINNQMLTATTNVRIQNDGSKRVVAYSSLVYPRNFHASNEAMFRFNLSASENKRYFEITNLLGSIGNTAVYDIMSGERLEAVYEDGLIKFVLEPSTEPRSIIVSNDNTADIQVTELDKVSFTNFSADNHDYIIISNPFLEVDTLNGNVNWVQEYADYRASEQGGAYNVGVYNVYDLIDQFGYGIDLHPQSIRNFGHYINRNWDELKYVLLLGKGREYRNIRTVNDGFPNLIPTWGRNGADNLLFASNESNVPLFSVGRVPAVTANEIGNYLNKIKEYESPIEPSDYEERLWRKNIIHLNGGASDAEINTIRSYMDLMAFNISNNFYSGSVESFYKTRENATGESQAAKLTRLINEGAGLITFFGHSAATAFDYSINNPDEFENYGRYFIMNAMGCNSGQIHSNVKSLSEQFILSEGKGAIAFMASSGLGYISAYRTFGLDHYAKIGEENYGETLGKSLLENLNTLDRTFATHKLLAQQMTLTGDPALIINPVTGPDYIVEEESVSFNPVNLNTELDSFEISFNTANLGGGELDSIYITIEQELPDGSKVLLSRTKERTPKYTDRKTTKIYNLSNASQGLNRFHISLDVDNDVQESPDPYAEGNNDYIHRDGKAGFPIFIHARGIELEDPTEFNIVGEQPTTLTGKTGQTTNASNLFYVQIDTTELFNSPLFVEEVINTTNDLVEWQPNINYQEDVVYYWRMSPDSTGQNGFVWKNASFIYKDGISGGWNQSHYYQLKKDQFTDIELNQDRSWSFNNDVVDIKLFNTHATGSILPEIYINNSYIDTYRSNTVNAGIYVFVFDQLSGQTWDNPPGGLYNSINNFAARTLSYFPYRTDSIQYRQDLIQFLQNDVPEGGYVGIMTIDKATSTFHSELWAQDSVTTGQNLFQVFENEGASQIRSLNGQDKSYIFLYQKGVGAIAEKISAEEGESIELNSFINTVWHSGRILSTRIGPSRSWNNLEVDFKDMDGGNDSTKVNIFGEDLNGNLFQLYTGVDEGNFDLSDVPANDFPFLRLEYFSTDSENRTAQGLNYWRVFYEPGLSVKVEDVIPSLSQLHIYPNPFEDVLTVEMEFEEKTTISTEIFNAVGQRVYLINQNETYSAGNHKQTMNVGNLIPGTYYLRILSEKGSQIRKLIKL